MLRQVLLPNFKKGDVMGVKIVVILSVALSSCTNASITNIKQNNEFKYAVSYCLSQAYPETKFSSDSKYVSGAYIQKGEFGIDMYEKLREFVDSYRDKKYQSKHDRNLDVMQCLDLYGSTDLAAVIKSHVNK